MDDALSSVLNIATLVFAVSSMASVGFSYTIQQIIDRLRHPRLVILTLVANFILVPVWAYLIISVLSIGESREIGLLVVATAAGAPFVLQLARVARADIALVSGLLVMLLVATVLYMPAVVPLIAPGAEVSALAIATPLFLTMLLPLIISLILDSIYPALGDRLQPILGNLSMISLLVLIATTVVLHFGTIIDVFGSGAILAALLFVAGAFGGGYVLGMTGRGTRQEVGLATGQRNIAAAMVVATQAIGEPDTVVMVVITSLAAFAVLFPTARLLRPGDEPAPDVVGAEEKSRVHG